jgi:two-component system, response regulator PdtaR
MDINMKNVLIGEDEALSAIALSSYLKKKGFTNIIMVSSGEDVLKSVTSEEIDIILLDIRLIGEFSGIEVAEKIRSDKNIPIIFMTGYSDQDLIDKISSFTNVDVVTKPFAFDDILEKMNIFLNLVK